MASGLAGGRDNIFSDMMTIRPRRTARVSSWDRKGGNHDCLVARPGQKHTLAELKGPAVIRHLYVTTIDHDPLQYRKIVLRMFWDGEEEPSVEVPFGDLFGAGLCLPRPFQSLPVALNPGGLGRVSFGFNLYFPMPFARSARIEYENESEVRHGGLWYHIEYEELEDLPENLGRFHAQWRRENPCKGIPRDASQGKNLTGKENYVILGAKGQGNYVGFFLNVDNLCGGWYGEGDDMIFVDGEKFPPSYHGTGTEEIFGGGAGPNAPYFGPYTGFHLVSNRDYSGKQSMYRFHVNDPVRFQKSVRVTLEHGHANDLSNDYSSTAFWYQIEPHARFPKLLPVRERLPRFPDAFWEGYGCWLEVLQAREKRGWRRLPLEQRQYVERAGYRAVEALFDQRWDDLGDVARGALAIASERRRE